jgi:hypothetical protein
MISARELRLDDVCRDVERPCPLLGRTPLEILKRTGLDHLQREFDEDASLGTGKLVKRIRHENISGTFAPAAATRKSRKVRCSRSRVPMRPLACGSSRARVSAVVVNLGPRNAVAEKLAQGLAEIDYGEHAP